MIWKKKIFQVSVMCCFGVGVQHLYFDHVVRYNDQKSAVKSTNNNGTVKGIYMSDEGVK